MPKKVTSRWSPMKIRKNKNKKGFTIAHYNNSTFPHVQNMMDHEIIEKEDIGLFLLMSNLHRTFEIFTEGN